MTTMPEPLLSRLRETVLPGLQAAVALMDPASSARASYHLGWTAIDGAPLDSDGGKSLRAALALLSAEVTGAPVEVAVPGAVAVELVHNFSLIHDDVMDRDAERRHRPTVWAVWGVPSAILTGDAMLVAAHRALIDSKSPRADDALRLLLEATQALIGGQVADLEFETRADVSLEDCEAMTAGKTGALLSASAAIGAVLADAAEPTVQILARYGAHVGAAFQLVDDLLGIWGDPGVTGKPVLSDLARRKKSLPVSYVLSRGGESAHRLADYLEGTAEAPDDADLAAMADLVESAGGRRWTLAEADRQVRSAIETLRELDGDPAACAELAELARFVGARHH